MTQDSKIRKLLNDAIGNGVIPCAAYAVGQGNDIWESDSLGYRSVYPK